MTFIIKIKWNNISKNPNIRTCPNQFRWWHSPRGTIMTSFVNTKQSTHHVGAERVTSAMSAAKQAGQQFSGTRGLATLLLSAVAAAVMVVAYQVMDSVAEGHLLVIWIAMWAVAFIALALFAGTARNLAVRAVAALDVWSSSVARGRADMRLWEAAKADPRVMADLQVALTRAGEEAADAPALPKRTVRVGGSELRAYQRNYI
jgi:hypothetical protein